MDYRPSVTALLAFAVAAWHPASAHPWASNGTARGGALASKTGNGTPLTAPARPATQTQPAKVPTGTTPSTASHASAVASGAPAASSATPTTGQRQYFVEIVIFRARVALGTPEDWQAETGMARTVTGGEAPSGSGIGQLIDLLPASQYRLTSIADILRGSRAYTTVAHVAWEQTASAWGTHSGFTLQQLGVDVPGLTGQVYLERGQYLHLGMTLDYTEQHPPAGLGAAPGTTFVLNETRRVRYYRRNYYDNPAFGVIALVLPVQGPQPPGR